MSSLIRPSTRIYRLCLKELRETLRDRRTILTLVLMPVLVYPLLAILFTRFVTTGLGSENEQPLYVIGTLSKREAQFIKQSVDRVNRDIINSRRMNALEGGKDATDLPRSKFDTKASTTTSPVDLTKIFSYRLVEGMNLDEAVESLRVDVGIRVHDLENIKENPPRETDFPLNIELVYRENSPAGEEAVAFLESRFDNENLGYFKQRLRERTGNRFSMAPLLIERRRVEAAETGIISIGALVPLILILMTITGAVYPSIDLTAGERERGTLETLIAAPIPRRSILFAKYISVLVVASMTATINLVAMVVTAQSSGLNEALFGPFGLQISMIGQLFALMVLFAAFFSAVLLAITCLARSFKEAQAYTIPLMLISLAPGVVSLFPGIELSGSLSVVPLVNIVLLTRDMFAGEVELIYATVAIISTILYAIAALGVAATIFGTDAILYGSPNTWGDMFRRPQQKQEAPMLSLALFCLAILFPLFFVSSGWLGQFEGGLQAKLALSAGLTIALFGGIPFVACLAQRIDLKKCFSFHSFRLTALLGAVLLGVSLWTMAYELILFCNSLGIATINSQQLQLAESFLESLKRDKIPLIALLLSTALTPAIFEELFFRGFLTSAIRRRCEAASTIVYVALLFGLFHVIVKSGLAVERMVPTTFLGLALGVIAHRTGSLLPAIITHATSNALLLSFAYYKDEMIRAGLSGGEGEHLPIWLLTIALIVSGIGFWLIYLSGRDGTRTDEKLGES